MPRIIRSVGLPSCTVCQKQRQKSAFFAEHNPKGQLLTCKRCSLADQIYCPSCTKTHTRSEMLSVLNRVGEICPSGISEQHLPVAVESPSQDLLVVLVKTLELLAEKVGTFESLLVNHSIPSQSFPDREKLESLVRDLEHREREALEDFCRAEDARKALEDENRQLKLDLAEKDNLLSSLGQGRDQLLQHLWRVHDALKA